MTQVLFSKWKEYGKVIFPSNFIDHLICRLFDHLFSVYWCLRLCPHPDHPILLYRHHITSIMLPDVLKPLIPLSTAASVCSLPISICSPCNGVHHHPLPVGHLLLWANLFSCMFLRCPSVRVMGQQWNWVQHIPPPTCTLLALRLPVPLEAPAAWVELLRCQQPLGAFCRGE